MMSPANMIKSSECGVFGRVLFSDGSAGPIRHSGRVTAFSEEDLATSDPPAATRRIRAHQEKN